MYKTQLVDIELTLKHETPEALLVEGPFGECWIPKSRIEDNGDGTFTLLQSYAEELELV